MKATSWLVLSTLVLAVALASSAGTLAQGQRPSDAFVAAAPADNDAKIQENLAKLSPEDRKLAESQKYCAVEEENRLGAMGKPVKVMLNGQAVFLCCKGCLKQARANPEQTAAKAKELQEKNSK
jgi:hypothetical protein